MAKKRTHGTGTVFKDATSGVYRYQWTDPNTGRKRTASLGTKDRAEAETKAKTYTATHEANKRSDVIQIIAKDRQTIERDDLPLADVWGAYQKTKVKAGDGTLRNYKRALRDFIAWLAEYRPSVSSWAMIDKQTVESYLADLWRSGISANTYNYRRNALGTITKSLEGKYGILGNFWNLKEHREKEAQQSREALTSKQASAMLELLDNPERHIIHREELRVAALLCLYAGMRLKDACLLQWHCVNLNHGTITYTPAKTAKTGKKACTPILPPLRTALVALPGYGTAGDVLPAVADNYRRNPDGIQKPLVALIQEAAGTDGRDRANEAIQRKVTRSVYGAHSLRHTFATMAAAAGAKPAYLALMLGDSTKTVDRYYVHIGLAMELADGFGTITNMIEARLSEDPDRAQLHRLADDDKLTPAEIRQILAFAARMGTKALPAAAKTDA